MSNWIGYMVSIDTKNSGTFQGEISTATSVEITLKKPFSNGIPCSRSEITIRAQDIANLNLIEKQENALGQSTVTVAKPIAKRANRTTTGEVVAKPITPSASQNNSNKPKPALVDIPNNSIESRNGFTNKKEKGKGKLNKKDEVCFGTPAETISNTEFDFEKNLALFDKQAVWNKINSQRPDVVKQTDGHRKQSKYRHDENILTTLPTVNRQISVPRQEYCEFVTDDGLIIPSVPISLRKKLFAVADRVGLKWERQVELIGRATAEMSLQLLGGCRRLNPQNTHQCPNVVVLCTPDRQGALGINTARHLASHAVKTVVFVTSVDSADIRQELSLYKLTQNKVVNTISHVPQVVDLIITSFGDSMGGVKSYQDIVKWANNNKASVLAIDPPSIATPDIATKFTIASVLPLAYTPANGKLYLCNLGFPQEVFSEVGIKYKSPFGSKFVIPLHPNEAQS